MSQILLLLCSSSLSHFPEKNTVAARARVGERSYADWKGSAAPSGKTAIYGGPPKSCPDVIHSGLD